MPSVLIHSPQYRPNLSSMVRTAEFYGLKRIYVVDRFGLLKKPTNKKQRADMAHMARVWTAGAMDHIDIITIEDELDFLQSHTGRVVATLVDQGATTLSDFTFEEEDLIVFGNERDGLPDSLLSSFDARIYIPQRGHTDCINVAVSFGIVLDRAIN